jgi:hypothetical protein
MTCSLRNRLMNLEASPRGWTWDLKGNLADLVTSDSVRRYSILRIIGPPILRFRAAIMRAQASLPLICVKSLSLDHYLMLAWALPADLGDSPHFPDGTLRDSESAENDVIGCL